jgi:LAS superfamily LD-carboxypeptidase LdcB
MVKNPNSILVLVNKTNNLSSDYKPSLVIPDVAFPFSGDNPKKYMRKEAADALEELYNQSKKDGVKIYAVSGYRSYSTQESIFNREVQAKGGSVTEANKTVAVPGQSEHQTGLAMDMTCAAVGYGLSESFENTKEGKWLKNNAHKFGFIIRYPKGKTSITGYSYEPWHIRYVGSEAAEYIYSKGITFEEFHNMISGN